MHSLYVYPEAFLYDLQIDMVHLPMVCINVDGLMERLMEVVGSGVRT